MDGFSRFVPLDGNEGEGVPWSAMFAPNFRYMVFLADICLKTNHYTRAIALFNFTPKRVKNINPLPPSDAVRQQKKYKSFQFSIVTI